MKPTDLILKFALLAQRISSQAQDARPCMDFNGMQAIPALHSLGTYVNASQATQMRNYLNDELLTHYDLLNGVTPVTKLFSRLNNVDGVMKGEAKRLTTLPQQYRPLRKLTIEDLKSANFQITFNQDYAPCEQYEPHTLLTGLIPTTMKPRWGTKDVDIVDIFEINKDAFTAGHEDFNHTVGLENDRELHMRFIPQIQSNRPNAVEKLWQVQCEIYDSPAKPDQHWKVRTFFNIIWSGEYLHVCGVYLHISPLTGSSRPGQLAMTARELIHFSDNNAVRTPYDIYPPDHYELRDPLSVAVEVYNELENTIHFGTDSLIPRRAIRAGIREFLRHNGYYPVTPSKVLTEKEVTLALLDAVKGSDDKGRYQIRKKSAGEYIQFSTHFHSAAGSEQKSNGIWNVQLNYSKVQHLFAPEAIESVTGYLDLRGGQHTVEFGILVQEGEEPKLVMSNQHLTLRTLYALLGVITKLNKLQEDESASQ